LPKRIQRCVATLVAGLLPLACGGNGAHAGAGNDASDTATRDADLEASEGGSRDASGAMVETSGGDASPDEAASNANGDACTPAPAASAAPAPPLDTVIFGDAVSETSHQLTSNASEIITPTPGQTARRLDPRTDAAAYGGIYGGDMTFAVQVDPTAQNYFTVKLSGDDVQGSGLLLDIDGLEVGNRHGGDQALLLSNTEPAYAPFTGRFYYRTVMLPLLRTFGKKSVTLRIRASAPFDSYAANAQSVVTPATGGIYRGYIHLQPAFDPAGETQGAPLATPPVAQGNNDASVQAVRTSFNTEVAGWLAGSGSLDPDQTETLANAYSISWSPAYQNAAAVSRAVEAIDAQCRGFNATPASVSNAWGGYYGPIGQAVALLATPMGSTVLGATVSLGAAAAPRRAQWAAMLQASRDHGRFSDRRAITNQVIISSTNIYKANRGLLALSAASAFAETNALRYIEEAAGLTPFLGDDQMSGGSAMPYGSQFHLVTSKGLTHETGMPGSDYGEQQNEVTELWRISGDSRFLERAAVMAHARSHFQYPYVDASGNRMMAFEDAMVWRNEYYPGRPRYTGWGVAAHSGDLQLAAYADQALDDHQLDYIDDIPHNEARAIFIPDDYDKLKTLPSSGAKLPGTDGQPDFAWADEEDAVVAVKHGTELFFAQLYHRAYSMNGLATVHDITPTVDHYAEIDEQDVQFAPNGNFMTRSASLGIGTDDALWPDHPQSAYQGLRQMSGLLPSDATDRCIDYGCNNPPVGLASFYGVRYAHFLVGMNTTNDETFELHVPAGFSCGVDLISGTPMSAPIKVGPASTVVFYLDDLVDAQPVPATPRFLTGQASVGKVTLDWDPAAGAASYTVGRATAAGGPYTTLQAGVTVSGFPSSADFADGTVMAGTRYFYTVLAVNRAGQSGPSPELAITAR